MPHDLRTVLKVSIAKGRACLAAGICQLEGCRKKAGKRKVYCCRHHHEVRKTFDPVGYIFSLRKQRAKARGHEWTIELPNWRDWCASTGYHLDTGRTCTSASLERKNSAHGYHIWNIRILTLAQNSAKGTKADGGYYWEDDLGVTHYVAPVDYEDAPF